MAAAPNDGDRYVGDPDDRGVRRGWTDGVDARRVVVARVLAGDRRRSNTAARDHTRDTKRNALRTQPHDKSVGGKALPRSEPTSQPSR